MLEKHTELFHGSGPGTVGSRGSGVAARLRPPSWPNPGHSGGKPGVQRRVFSSKGLRGQGGGDVQPPAQPLVSLQRRQRCEAVADSLRKVPPHPQLQPRLCPRATPLLSGGKSLPAQSTLRQMFPACHSTLPSPFLPLFRVWIRSLTAGGASCGGQANSGRGKATVPMRPIIFSGLSQKHDWAPLSPGRFHVGFHAGRSQGAPHPA